MMENNILTTTNPYHDIWFRFIMYIYNDDRYDYWCQEKEDTIRKYSRIAEGIASGKVTIGDPFLIEVFIEDVKNGFINNYDGFGEYVSFEDFSMYVIDDIEDVEKLEKYKDTHFIVWYNK